MFKKLLSAISSRLRQHNRSNSAALVARETQRYRLLTGYKFNSNYEIVLRALKQQNQIATFGLNPGDVEELCKYFAQYGLPKLDK